MWRTQVPGAELRAVASGQSDLVTTGQAAAAGFGRDGLERMVRDGHWQRRANGLFDTAPGHESFAKRAWSAMLLADQPSAVGGDAALRLHGLDRPDRRIVVWVPADRRPRSRQDVQVRRDKLGRIARSSGDPARITAEDAIVDVGQFLGAEALVGLLCDASRTRITTLERVRRTLDQRRRVRNREGFLELLNDLEGIESPLEHAYLRDVERAHGLPQARRQVSVSSGTRTDVFYEEFALLVELDGRTAHLGAGAAFRDLRRDNAHALKALTTLRYGSADVRGRPCAVARQVWHVVSARGWPEPLRPCGRCAGTVDRRW